MSDNFETEETNTVDQNANGAIENLSIQDLRKLATSYGIKAQRDWDREDFIMAINTRRQNNTLVELAYDDSKGPRVGHARIIIQSSETGSNHPIPVNVNNYKCIIPRDVAVDVPFEVVEALNNSKTPVRAKDPKGGVNEMGKPKLVWKDVLSYPFQVVAMGQPGVARHTNGAPKIKPSTDPQKHSLKVKYKEIFGRWPKRDEFKAYRDMHMAKLAEKAMAREDIELAKKSQEK